MAFYLYPTQESFNDLNSIQTRRPHQSNDSRQLVIAPNPAYEALPEAGALNMASVLADLRKASSESNPHRAIKSLHSLIRRVTHLTPSFHTKDYSISPGTINTSMNDLEIYSMRDAIQWWAHWHGSMMDNYWKHIYIAFSIIPEDATIPPQHLLDGEFRLLGNSLADMLNGLRKENVSADNIAFMEKCLLQQYLVQYLDKKEPKFSGTIRSDSECRTRWRDIMANTCGSTTGLLVANQSESLGLVSTAIQMTITENTLSMELASHSLIAATLNSQVHCQGLEPALREVYLKYMGLLHMIPTAPLLSRSVSSGLHFIPRMDGARERRKHVRFPMTVSLRNRVRSYSQ